MVKAASAAGDGRDGVVEGLEVGFEEGGEGRVSCTCVGGRLEVPSPEGAVLRVVVR